MNNKTKTVLFASLIATMILPFSIVEFVEAEQVNEKISVRNSIEAKMQEQESLCVFDQIAVL